MKGGTRRPSDYTGRLGLPKFERMGEVAVLRIPVTNYKSGESCEELSLSRLELNSFWRR